MAIENIKILGAVLELPIAIDADYSYEVKNSEIWAPTFFKHNNSFIATVITEALAEFRCAGIRLTIEAEFQPESYSNSNLKAQK